jgi:hypothetical protein
MATNTIKFDLSNGVDFARNLKMHTDVGDDLTTITVDAVNATAACTFDDSAGAAPAPPTGDPFHFDASNGVELARVIKMHTAIGNKLIWTVVHVVEATVDCWFE